MNVQIKCLILKLIALLFLLNIIAVYNMLVNKRIASKVTNEMIKRTEKYDRDFGKSDLPRLYRELDEYFKVKFRHYNGT